MVARLAVEIEMPGPTRWEKVYPEMMIGVDPPSSAAKLPAVVLGGGLTALSVARSLAAAGVNVHLLDGHDSPARWSRAVSNFVDVGSEQPQEHMLEWLRSGPAPAVVLAGADEGLEVIARNRALLLELGYRPLEADDEVLLAMLDKVRTYALAREHGIPVPQTIPLRDRDQLEAAVEEIEFPCVLKPAHSHLFARRARTGAKVSIVNSPAELRATFEQLSALNLEVFVTEVVYGLSDEFVSYFGYLDPDGQLLLSFTKRKIRQNPPGFGIGTYHESTDDPEVAELGLRFLRAVGLKGLGNVEFKRDARNGELKLIECNPRFTLSNELIRASGVDLALFSYNRAAGYPTTPVNSYRVGMRLLDPFNDMRAFIAYRRLGELSVREWLGSLMYPQRFPAFRTNDPLPALARAASRLRNARSRGQRARRAPSTRSTESPATRERRGAPARLSEPAPWSGSERLAGPDTERIERRA